MVEKNEKISKKMKKFFPKGGQFKITFKLLVVLFLLSVVVFAVIMFGITTFGITTSTDENVLGYTEKDVEDELLSCKQDYGNLCSAITSGDKTYCDSINIGIAKDSCLTKTSFISYILETGDENLCDETSELSSKECLNILDSFKTEDRSVCEGEVCGVAFDFRLAVSEDNINLCEDITDESTKNYCKLYLTSDMDHCDYSYCYDTYYVHMTEVTGDIGHCSNVLNPEGKQACLEYGKT